MSTEHIIDPQSTETPAMSYEQAYSQLEKIVSQLESGDVSLDDSVKLFVQGTELAKLCTDRLNAIEHQISQLIVAADGTVQESSFGVSDV